MATLLNKLEFMISIELLEGHGGNLDFILNVIVIQPNFLRTFTKTWNKLGFYLDYIKVIVLFETSFRRNQHLQGDGLIVTIVYKLHR